MTEAYPKFDDVEMDPEYRLRMVKRVKNVIARGKLNMTPAESVEVFAYLLVDVLARRTDAEELLVAAVMRAMTEHKVFSFTAKQDASEALKRRMAAAREKRGKS